MSNRREFTTQRREAGITTAQQRALFAAAKRATLTIEELRAMTPRKSISNMTAAEASALLDRLNHGTAHARNIAHDAAPPHAGSAGVSPATSFTGVPPVKPRRPSGIFAFVTPGQRLLIDHLRLELGWSPAQLTDWLGTRHYRSDQSRPMSKMDSSADAVAVIELLKAVRDRTYAAHRPPHPRQDDTLTHVKARLRAARGQSPADFAAWWNDLRTPDGRYLRNVATARETSLAIEIATRELDKALNVGRVTPGSTGVPPATEATA